MLIEKIIIPEMKLMPQTTVYEEKRLVVIGVVAILNDMAKELGYLNYNKFLKFLELLPNNWFKIV